MAAFPAIEYPAASTSPSTSTLAGHRYRTVLLATDLSPVSDCATEEAIHLCQALSARLLIVNVVDGRQAAGREWLGEPRARIDQHRAVHEGRLMRVVHEARLRGVDAEFLVWTGDPGQSIVSAGEAEDADLIVVGTRALDRAGKFLLGSVSDHVVNHSKCPVVIAR